LDKRYNIYSDFLKEKYNEKVYKLPVNLPGTCPNRDGNLSVNGCTFCDEDGSGFECLPNELSVTKQIEANRVFFIRRFKAKKFIVYFQAFTNTYMEFDVFKKCILEATSFEDVVGISISTRPDCLPDQYLDFLKEVKLEFNLEIEIELGLQTVNYHTLIKVNRGHTLAEYIDAVLQIKKRGFALVTHLILNLPYDNETDVVENAKILSAIGSDYVKLHSLYIVKGTPISEEYNLKKFEMISLEEYVQRVVTFLEYLDPKIVVQRIVGKGPQGNMDFCNWSTSWWKIKIMIEEALVKQNTFQGKKFNYLYGSAVVKKEF
jgi:hypothetical protein